MQAGFRLEMHLVGVIQNGLETVPVLNCKHGIEENKDIKKERACSMSNHFQITDPSIFWAIVQVRTKKNKVV